MTTPAALADLIAARCPEWAVDSVAQLGAGDFCVAYLVNGAWVFRVPRHAEAAASLLREVCLLPRIARQFDLRIPAPRIVGAAGHPPLIAYPLLPGPALTPERYARLPIPARDRCARQLARFLRRMHATDPALARRCGIPVADSRAQYGEVLARARRHLFETLAAPVRAFTEHAITAYLTSAAPSAFPSAVLHGDLSHDHILYDEGAGTLTGVIDFGDVTVGDPAWDFVYLYEEYGADFLRRCVRAYAGAGRPALLERIYRLFVLSTIAWAVECAEERSDELGDAVAQVGNLQASGERPLHELLAARGAANADGVILPGESPKTR